MWWQTRRGLPKSLKSMCGGIPISGCGCIGDGRRGRPGRRLCIRSLNTEDTETQRKKTKTTHGSPGARIYQTVLFLVIRGDRRESVAVFLAGGAGDLSAGGAADPQDAASDDKQNRD